MLLGESTIGAVPLGAMAFSVNAPSAPTLSALTAGNGTLSGTITPGASNGGSALTQFNIYDDTDDSLLDTVAADGTNPVPFSLTGLDNGVQLTIYATVENAIGESDPSGTVSGTPQLVTFRSRYRTSLSISNRF